MKLDYGETIRFRVPMGFTAAIQQAASADVQNVSSYIRGLIAADLRARGISVARPAEKEADGSE